MTHHSPFSLLLPLLALLSSACTSGPTNVPVAEAVSPWAADSLWLRAQPVGGDTAVDVFYLVSTEVMTAHTPSGEKAYTAQLTPADRSAIGEEMDYMARTLAGSDLNFFSPYYHQFTFEALGLPGERFDSVYRQVSAEVCEAFDYYMAHQNGGRRFVLAGFSQGALLTLDVLRHLTDEEQSRLVAAYVMGYRLSATDLSHPHIRAASDASTPGVTIAFNSVLDGSTPWLAVTAGSAACINPVNWHTDAEPATFRFEGREHTVRVDTLRHVLVVQTADVGPYLAWNDNPAARSAGVPADCLHHWDILFYTAFLHDNIHERAR